jgi:hypothetical protein
MSNEFDLLVHKGRILKNDLSQYEANRFINNRVIASLSKILKTFIF